MEDEQSRILKKIEKTREQATRIMEKREEKEKKLKERHFLSV